jgi:hypothetical protein
VPVAAYNRRGLFISWLLMAGPAVSYCDVAEDALPQDDDSFSELIGGSARATRGLCMNFSATTATTWFTWQPQPQVGIHREVVIDANKSDPGLG